MMFRLLKAVLDRIPDPTPEFQEGCIYVAIAVAIAQAILLAVVP